VRRAAAAAALALLLPPGCQHPDQHQPQSAAGGDAPHAATARGPTAAARAPRGPAHPPAAAQPLPPGLAGWLGAPWLAAGPRPPLAAGAGLPDFAGLFERASPSVVNIAAAHALPIPDEVLPRRDRRVWQALARSLGSGFALGQRGHLVTCSSVIEDAAAIEVTLADGRRLRAELVASDPLTDLAVLAVPAAQAPEPLELAPAGALRSGDWVAAFGYPFGLSHSISAGIVSTVRPAAELGSNLGLILSDVAINPGCNGGPLLDTAGRVVGINLVSGRDRSGGLGLAVSIHDALPIIAALERGRRPAKPWLGLGVQHVDADLARAFGLERARGALVSRLVDGGPAARAGLQLGDVVVGFAGRAVADPQGLIAIVQQAPLGRPLPIRVLRDGQPRQLRIRPQPRPR
jgi:serine protease Do